MDWTSRYTSTTKVGVGNGPQDLESLRQVLEQLERKIDHLYRHLGINYEEKGIPNYMADAAELVRKGKDTDAVKVIREYTATGIVEARQMVEQIKRNMGLITAFEPDREAFRN